MRFNTALFLASISAVTLALPVTRSGAQSPTPAQPSAARDTLSPAVITATRVSVSTVAPTVTTTVLRGDDLRARGITRVQDALRLVPGATLVASGPTGSQVSLFLRGGNSNYVRVLIDGVPINDAGGIVDLAHITTDNLDRIEVVRGPASVLYGSDAVTGVIQLFTREGRGALKVHALVGDGSEASMRGELGLSGGNATVGYSIFGAHHSTDGMLAFNNTYVNDVLSGSLRLTPDSRTDARVSARWSGATYHYPTEYDGTVADHNSEQTDHRFLVSIDAGRKLTERVELRTTLASNEYLPRSNDGPDTKADTLGFYGYYARSARTRRSADVRLNARLNERATVTVGAEFARDREQSTSLSLSQYGPSAGGFEAARHNTGWYAQAIGDATDRMSYAVGARLDQNSAFGSFSTTRASAAFTLGPSVRAHVAVGSAFKAPSFFENFAAGYTVGNPALKPERSQSAELGIDAFLADGLVTLNATGYMQQFRDVIQYSGTTPKRGTPNYYNVAGANANGVEVAAIWRAAEHTTINGTWAWTDTRVTEAGFDKSAGASYVKGEKLLRRPPHTITLNATQSFATGASISLTGIRVGARDDRDFAAYPVVALSLPAYTKLDISAVVPVTSVNGLAIVARVDNALGAKYEEVSRYRAPGTVAFVGVRFER